MLSGQTADRGPGFLVIPAVDVLEGAAVRLERGDFSRVRAGARDPEAFVCELTAAGASLIHVVDLEGARAGRIRPGLVKRLIAAADEVAVQVSGGIRSLRDARALVEAGAHRVVVGTAAFGTEASLERLVTALGERLVVAVDVRDGRVALEGWERSTEVTADDAVDRCVGAGVERILCTAIERDGTLSGPDTALLRRVRARAGIPVIAAGGIRSEADLTRLASLGLEGAVVGRAVMEGALPLSVLGRWGGQRRADGGRTRAWAQRRHGEILPRR